MLKQLFNIPSTRYSATNILRWLLRAWRGNYVQAVLNASIGLIDVGISLAQVWAVKHAIDVAAGTVPGNIYWAVGLMAALILASFAENIGAVWVRNILGIKAQNRMQQQMLDRLLRSEWAGQERRHSGDILNRLETDVSTVVNFLTETIPSTLSVLALFIGAFVYLFSMDHVLALIIVAIIPVFVAFSKIYVRRMRQLTRDVRNSDSEVQSVLQETVQHRMLIKTLESDTMMVERLENTQGQLRRKVVRRTVFSLFSNLILNFGFALGYLVAFLWAAVRMSAGSLSFGGMTAFLQLVNKIQSPARSLTKLVPAFVGVFTAAERLMELEEDPLEEQGTPVRMDSPCGVRLSNVSYAYGNDGRKVLALQTADAEEAMGVNSRVQLAQATHAMQHRINNRHMMAGVTMWDPESTFIGPDVEIAQDVELWPQTYLLGATKVGSHSVIGPNTRLTDTQVGCGARVDETVAIEAQIDDAAECGPRAYLRPGTHLCEGAKVGTHVEIKKSTIGKGSKVPHLSYIGDTTMGENVNIGAGSITCNYDGVNKNHTEIGDNVFVGSDTMMVAPVNIGAGAIIGASSCITRDVAPDALALERADQREIEGWAAKHMAKLKAKKEAAK